MDRRGLGVTAPIFTEFTQRRRNARVKKSTWIDLERNWDFLGPGGQLPREGTQFDPDPYADVRARNIDPIRRGASQPVLMQPETVEVSAVLVDATLRQRDRILPSVSDSVMIGLVRGVASLDGMEV